jgi:hypothetical protein
MACDGKGYPIRRFPGINGHYERRYIVELTNLTIVRVEAGGANSAGEATSV